MREVAVVVGNPRPASRTGQVAIALAERVATRIGGRVSVVVDLAEHAATVIADPSPVVTDLAAAVARSDVAVISSPTYKAAYTGLLKAFLDLYPDNGLHGVTAIPLLTAGSPLHALAVETHLRPLLVELGATVPTRGLCFLMSRMDELDAVLDVWADANLDGLRWPVASP